jgi:hypothetical protein
MVGNGPCVSVGDTVQLPEVVPEPVPELVPEDEEPDVELSFLQACIITEAEVAPMNMFLKKSFLSILVGLQMMSVLVIR